MDELVNQRFLTSVEDTRLLWPSGLLNMCVTRHAPLLGRHTTTTQVNLSLNEHRGENAVNLNCEIMIQKCFNSSFFLVIVAVILSLDSQNRPNIVCVASIGCSTIWRPVASFRIFDKVMTERWCARFSSTILAVCTSPSFEFCKCISLFLVLSRAAGLRLRVPFG